MMEEKEKVRGVVACRKLDRTQMFNSLPAKIMMVFYYVGPGGVV
jgi:hypothetical protein